MNSNAKRDAAAREFFIERYNGNGSFKVLNAEPNVVHDTKITINGETMSAYTYFHVIEKSARDAEVAELRVQLDTLNEEITNSNKFAQDQENKIAELMEQVEELEKDKKYIYQMKRREFANIRAELKTKDEAIEVAVKALACICSGYYPREDFILKMQNTHMQEVSREALHSLNTLLGREG